MPTGYTSDICYGEKGVSFQKFILTCARNFGATITMRDEPLDALIPEEFKPDDYNHERLIQAKANLTRALNMSDRQVLAASVKTYKDSCKSYLESLTKSRALRSRYETMLAQVRAWTPPSTDHYGLKDFMVEQLTMSIDHDCSTYPRRWPRQKSVTGYRKQIVKSAKWDIAYHSKGWAEEIDRAEKRTTWIKQLRESLRNLS
ncbi:MAG: hypothetical protein HY225_01990 [Candidatus Vogelbacteria bacterium]|nr:hypothetical protein [Candidatus Vogelbacteria bacterium]